MRVAALAALALLLLLAVASTGRTRRYRGGAAAALGAQLVGHVPSTPDNQALLRRWRERATWWRRSISLPAVALTIVASVTLRSSLDVGIGAHPAWSDPLLMGLLGTFVGAVTSELHLLRRPVPQRRRAELAPRDLADHLPPGARRRLVVLAIFAGLACALTVRLAEGVVPILGLLALTGAGTVPLVQRGIVHRGRPAVGIDLREADDAVRRLAVHSIDQAGAGVVLLLTAWQLAPVYTAVDVHPVVEALLIVAQLTSLFLAIVWWRRSNPRRLLPNIPDVLGVPVATSAQP